MPILEPEIISTFTDPYQEVYARLNITASDVTRATQASKSARQSPFLILARLGLAKDGEIAESVSAVSGSKLNSLEDIPISAISIEDLSINFLRANAMLPLEATADEFVVGLVDPFDETALKALSFACAPRQLSVRVMALGDIERGLRTLYGTDLFSPEQSLGADRSKASLATDAETLKDLAREEPIIKLLDALFFEAIDARATDIHIEPKPQAILVRIRVDGALRQLTGLNLDQGPPIISRLKILADLDVANSRSPQDGRASIVVRGRPIDIRVSTVPAAYGESVAVRILDRSAIELDFEKLGLTGQAGETMARLIGKPHGLTIMTGPTGSGKTTTLYAALERIRSQKLKILTVEDPVEFRFEDVNQVQVNEAAGVTFASTLRAFLRQDPDIILVGEIRDSETARIAVQAALTGHLVLATLHTNDAASAPARLIDMGVEPYLLASVFNGAAAQRLVRRLCPHCMTQAPATTSQLQELENLGFSIEVHDKVDPIEFAAPAGCKKCDDSGYRGRTALVEVFEARELVRSQIHRRVSLDELRGSLRDEGMKGLLQDGIEKSLQGLTSLDEVLAIVGGMDLGSQLNSLSSGRTN